MFSAGYVGSRGAHVAFVVPNLDLAPAAAGAIQQRRTYYAQLPGVTTIGMFDSDFDSTYNAMQLVFQRRHRNGLTHRRELRARAHAVDAAIAERHQRDRALRRRLRHPSPVRVHRPTTSCRSRQSTHWRGEAIARRLAGQRRRLPGRPGSPFNVTNADRACQHQCRQRSPEPGRRSERSNPTRRAVVQHGGVRRPDDQHHRQRARATCSTDRRSGASTCRCSRTSG